MEDMSSRAALDLITSLVTTPDQSPLLALQRLMYCSFDTSPFGHPTFDSFPDSSPHKILLPSSSFDEQPQFVNPKQYHRILKRRVARSKQKPMHRTAYLHESRHKHACKRKRDEKGMFVSKQEGCSQGVDRLKQQL